jgi:dihydrodiol dehydrogenase / D-xylose 1-dehydrogenase (NADP)
MHESINLWFLLRLKSLGGGSMLNLGIYCIQLATFVFGDQMKPFKVLGGGHMNGYGVDECLTVTLTYTGGKTASLTSDIRAELTNDAVIVGTKGMIKVFEQEL